MFQIDDVTLSDEVALTKFACNLPLCKGLCCVIGDAGAPVSEDEVPVLRKAYNDLKSDLRPRAIEVIENEGLIKRDEHGNNELNFTDGRECVFVTYDNDGTAVCAIHKAFAEGRFQWKKPVSCHLFPLRINKMGGRDFVNFEYVPMLCSSACKKGEDEGIYLSDFLEEPLVRHYGSEWFARFALACKKIRKQNEVDA